MKGKTFTDNQLRGGQGPAIVELAVSEMGFVWRPTSQHDTGIDGEIEVRDPVSGAMTGLIIKAQVKTSRSLVNETEEDFDYSPERRDVRYWLSYNVPVILIVCQSTTKDAFWLPVREFAPGSGERTRLHFNKTRDRLGKGSAARLVEFAKATTPWANAPSLDVSETLLSNLLPVSRLPERLFLGETAYPDAKRVGNALRERNLACEFVLKNRRILTPRDLSDAKYRFLVDQGTVEDFAIGEWADTDDQDKKRDFVHLLNGCTRALFNSGKTHLIFDRNQGCYFFPASPDLRPYNVSYMSSKKKTDRQVFKVMRLRGNVLGYRHSAMVAHYARYDKTWYLEVTPTYYFSQNGRALSRRHSKWLKGIKEQEKNGSVRGQLVMWASILTEPGDLLDDEYPFLAFGSPTSFVLGVGVDDQAWRDHESAASVAAEKITGQQFELVE